MLNYPNERSGYIPNILNVTGAGGRPAPIPIATPSVSSNRTLPFVAADFTQPIPRPRAGGAAVPITRLSAVSALDNDVNKVKETVTTKPSAPASVSAVKTQIDPFAQLLASLTGEPEKALKQEKDVPDFIWAMAAAILLAPIILRKVK